MKRIVINHSQSDCILEIRHIESDRETSHCFNALDEDGISEFVYEHIGDQLHELNNCPIFSEIAGWASNNAGANNEEYSLDHYEVNQKEWKIILWNKEV